MVVILNSLKVNAAIAAIVKKERKSYSFAGFIGNGSKLTAEIISMGIGYNPANANISLVNINLIQTSLVNTDNKEVTVADLEKSFLLARNSAYKEMPTKRTGLLNVFKSCKDVTPEQILIATNKGKKGSGTRIKSIKTVAAIAALVDGSADVTGSEINIVRRNSVSFQEFGEQTGSFFDMMTYITTQDCYDTNEDEYTKEALTAYYETLGPLNLEAEKAISATNNARKLRNEVFFNNTTGARFIYTQAKKYIAGKFGFKSAENQKVRKLPFPNLIPKKLRTPTTTY